MERLTDHVKGLLITGIGVLVLTPDSLLVRLIAIDQWSMIFWRGTLTALGLSAFLAAYYRGETLARFRAIGAAGLMVAILFVGSSLSFIIALNHTSVANTLIIVSAAPLFAAIFSRVFLAEAVAARTWLAIGGAIGGIAVIVSGSLEGGTLLGDASAVGTAVFIAAVLAVVRRARARNIIPAMALSGVLSALVVLPLATPFAVDERQAGLLLLLGLIVLPVSYALTMLGPRYLPAPEVGLILLLETVLGPFWVWLVLSEDPGPRALVGGAIVIAVLTAHSAIGLRQERRAAGG